MTDVVEKAAAVPQTTENMSNVNVVSSTETSEKQEPTSVNTAVAIPSGAILPAITSLTDEELAEQQKVVENWFTMVKQTLKHNSFVGDPDKDFIFRGLLRCGHCGGCITSEYHISKSGKRHNYLKCNNHGTSKSNCPQCVVREEDILQQLSDQIFSQIHVNEDFINAVKSGVKEHILQENRVNRASKQSIALQIQSVRNRESKLMDLYLNGKCTQALYEKKSAEFEEEIKKLEAGLEQNSDVSKDVTTALNHIIDVAGQAATIMNGSINSKKREFLKTILSNGVLIDKTACFYLKKPFDKLLFAKGCKPWLGQLDSNQ